MFLNVFFFRSGKSEPAVRVIYLSYFTLLSLFPGVPSLARASTATWTATWVWWRTCILLLTSWALVCTYGLTSTGTGRPWQTPAWKAWWGVPSQVHYMHPYYYMLLWNGVVDMFVSCFAGDWTSSLPNLGWLGATLFGHCASSGCELLVFGPSVSSASDL